MILHLVLLKASVIISFTFVLDESWNMSNPRPFPKQKYYMMQWEEDDFIKMKDGSYVLRPKQKADNNLKKYARKKAWIRKRNRF